MSQLLRLVWTGKAQQRLPLFKVWRDFQQTHWNSVWKSLNFFFFFWGGEWVRTHINYVPWIQAVVTHIHTYTHTHTHTQNHNAYSFDKVYNYHIQLELNWFRTYEVNFFLKFDLCSTVPFKEVKAIKNQNVEVRPKRGCPQAKPEIACSDSKT